MGCLVAGWFSSSPALSVQATVGLPVYDENADAGRDIAAAQIAAKATNRKLLLVFGANWCPDCRAFDAELNQPDLGSFVAEQFVVVKIDVARFKKNTDVAARVAVPIRRGIPAVGVTTADGRPLAVADGRKMEDLRAQGRAAVIKFLDASLKAEKSASTAR
jgi:thiol-disulfide isomerase/thioredoxin